VVGTFGNVPSGRGVEHEHGGAVTRKFPDVLGLPV
jgi:hypothetical protein